MSFQACCLPLYCATLTVLPHPSSLVHDSSDCERSLRLNLQHHTVFLKIQGYYRTLWRIDGSIDRLLHVTCAWSCRGSITSSWHLSMNCVVIIINILTSFKMWLEFMRRNILLPFDDLCCRRQHPCPLPTQDLVMCWLYHIIVYSWIWSLCILVILKPILTLIPCHCYPKHDCGHPNISKDIVSVKLNVSWVGYPNIVVSGKTSWLSLPLLSKEIWTCCPIMNNILYLILRRIYSQYLCISTFSFPLVWLILIIKFSFPLVCLTFLVICMVKQ